MNEPKEHKGIRRFVVFGYDTYYPSGGLRDALADFHTRDEAEACVLAHQHTFRHVYIEDLHETPEWRL